MPVSMSGSPTKTSPTSKSPPKKVVATSTASDGGDLLAQLQVAMKNVRNKVEVSDDEDAWEDEGGDE